MSKKVSQTYVQQVRRNEDLSIAKNSELIHLKQNQIVESASRLFFEKGFHATTTREIADACHMSKGQLYHYITSKNDILFLMHKYLSDIWLKKFLASGINKIKDPLQKIVAALRLTMNFMLDYRKFHLFLYVQGQYMDQQQKEISLRYDREITIQFWCDLLERMNRKNPIACGVDMGAEIILHNLFFFVFNKFEHDQETLVDLMESTIHFILRGLGLAPPP